MSNVRFCPSCGTQVSAEERFCGNCGTRMDDQSAPVFPTMPTGQQGSPTQVLPPTPNPPPPPSFGVPSGAIPPKRGLPVWAIILISLAGLCAIGCAASIAVVNVFGDKIMSAIATPTPAGLGGGIVPIPTRAGAAPTKAPLPTKVLVSTEEIPAPTDVTIPSAEPTSAGGGIIGDVTGNRATAEAPIAEAPTAEAAASDAEIAQANAELAALLAAGKQIFKDEFVDNRNSWFVGKLNDSETDTIADGVFKVTWMGKGTSYERYDGRDMTDFVAEVDCLVYRGGIDGGCGIVFDEKKDVGYYKFEVFDNYYWLLAIYPEGDPTILAEGDPTGIVKPSDVNRVRVIKQGDQIRIALNGIPLKTVKDSTYQTGKVGVSTKSENEKGGVEVWFDNFTIWEIPGN